VLQFGEVGGPMPGPGRFAAVSGSDPGAAAAGGQLGAGAAAGQGQQPAQQPAAGLQALQQQSARRGASSALEAALRDHTGPSDSIPATIMRDPELSTFISPRALQVSTMPTYRSAGHKTDLPCCILLSFRPADPIASNACTPLTCPCV
jgi:hypothetical protein